MATATIVASDGEILLSVRDAGIVNEGDEAVFVVELNGSLDDNLDVTYTTVEDTAKDADDDFESVSSPPGSFTIAAGQRSATIRVLANMDNKAENDEKFKVMLNETHDDVEIGDGEAEARIRDNDPLRANLSAPKSQVAGTSYDATVELTGGTPSANVEVTYQVVGGDTTTRNITAPATTATLPVATTGRAAGSTVVVNLVNVSTTAGRITRGTSSASTRLTDTNAVRVSVEAADADRDRGR